MKFGTYISRDIILVLVSDLFSPTRSQRSEFLSDLCPYWVRSPSAFSPRTYPSSPFSLPPFFSEKRLAQGGQRKVKSSPDRGCTFTYSFSFGWFCCYDCRFEGFLFSLSCGLMDLFPSGPPTKTVELVTFFLLDLGCTSDHLFRYKYVKIFFSKDFPVSRLTSTKCCAFNFSKLRTAKFFELRALLIPAPYLSSFDVPRVLSKYQVPTF